MVTQDEITEAARTLAATATSPATVVLRLFELLDESGDAPAGQDDALALQRIAERPTSTADPPTRHVED
jgi:hypothetical protein